MAYFFGIRDIRTCAECQGEFDPADMSGHISGDYCFDCANFLCITHRPVRTLMQIITAGMAG